MRRKTASMKITEGFFLNTQAGLIAREQLREGKPCPVCGSLEHPHPCQLEEEHRHLTREMLDDMEGKCKPPAPDPGTGSRESPGGFCPAGGKRGTAGGGM
mgnify:CR=1 FL=1